MDVYVTGSKLYGMRLWAYVVMVDGKKYDEFTTRSPITWAQEADVAAGYREALSDYVSPLAPIV